MSKNTTLNTTIEMQAHLSANIADVWGAFTLAKHLVNWWAPFGADMQVSELAPETGGIFHYSYLDGVHRQRWRRVFYASVTMQKSLVMELTVSDEQGHVIPLPLPGGLPQFLSASVELLPTAEGTLITVIANGPAGIATQNDSLPDEMAAMIERLKQYVEGDRFVSDTITVSATNNQLLP